MRVCVDPDTGCARASLAARDGGEQSNLDLSSMESSCRDAGIAVTDDVRTRLAELLEQFQAEPRAIERIIARPAAPIAGKDSFIDWREGFDPTLTIKVIDEDDRVDHYTGRIFIRVDAGADLGTYHAPTPGTDGRDVFGEPIPATPGKPLPMKIDTSVSLDSGGRMTAQRDGVITVKDKTILITKLLEISDHVDFSTGHVDFDGCVDIRQDVRDLFEIKASGGVSVGGLIEAATITCGGNFVGHRGMVGRGRGLLNVNGDAEIGFLNTTRGTIGGTLIVRREIIDCDLTVERGVVAEACAVIGGTLDLRGKSVIGTIGSPSDRPTHVMLTAKANLLVPKLIYPKVRFQIGKRVYEVNRETKGPVRIVADSKHTLAYRIADGVPRPLDEISSPLTVAA